MRAASSASRILLLGAADRQRPFHMRLDAPHARLADHGGDGGELAIFGRKLLALRGHAGMQKAEAGEPVIGIEKDRIALG